MLLSGLQGSVMDELLGMGADSRGFVQLQGPQQPYQMQQDQGLAEQPLPPTMGYTDQRIDVTDRTFRPPFQDSHFPSTYGPVVAQPGSRHLPLVENHEPGHPQYQQQLPSAGEGTSQEQHWGPEQQARVATQMQHNSDSNKLHDFVHGVVPSSEPLKPYAHPNATPRMLNWLDSVRARTLRQVRSTKLLMCASTNLSLFFSLNPNSPMISSRSYTGSSKNSSIKC